MTAAKLSWRAQLMRVTAARMIRNVLTARRPAAWRRQRLETIGRLSSLALPLGTRIEPTTLRGVAAEWVSNHCVDAQRTVLYFHGGGYLVGSPRMYRDLSSRIAQHWKARVAVVDYRLAPEHRFPAATDDCLNAYRSLLEQGIAPERIVIAGDSAGGGLTLATALNIREQGLPAPAALVLFSPWLDLTVDSDSARQIGDDDAMLSVPALLDAGRDYIGDQDPKLPLASPLFADLRGLPPMLVQVGDREILLDDSRRLAERVREVGGELKLEVWPGLFHVWQIFAGKMPEAARALLDAAAFLDRPRP
ncbi:MAG TPA: alpha/beta hydrolase [Solimonas sp.]